MKTTPKDFFLWAGAMIALYASAVSFISLMFGYVDVAFPDPLSYSYDPYSSGMRTSIATLVVLGPLLLVLMRYIRHDISKTNEKAELWVRRWALVLTVFVAGATIAIDLITLVNTYLGGEVTIRFALKALIVLLVAAGGLLHFLADIKGYWIKKPYEAQIVGYSVGALILISLVASVWVIGTPAQVRMYKLDDQRVSDLQNIQYQVINYYQTKQELPEDLNETIDPISGWVQPTDPETQALYLYKKISSLTFELCADFEAPTPPNAGSTSPMRPAAYDASYSKFDITLLPWDHIAGNVCFERTIDPDRYPPFRTDTGAMSNK